MWLSICDLSCVTALRGGSFYSLCIRRFRRVAVTLFTMLLLAVVMVLFVAFTGRDRSVLFGGPSSVHVGGRARTYRVAGNVKGPSPRRLVIALHGYTGNGRQFAYYTALHNAFGADTVVAYPDATKTTANGDKPGWNAQFCCGSGWKTSVDDVEFIRILIEELRAKFQIDAQRVFLVGFSNGAFMAQRFAAVHPDLVSGVAVISGTIGTKNSSLQPKAPVPMLLTHGAKDTRVRYDGGESPGDPEFDWLSFATTTNAWKLANGCNEQSAKVFNTSRRTTKTYEDCLAPLMTVEYLDNGHVWDGWRLANVWNRRPRASTEIATFFDSLL
jgi:polyhydroxybutyrate depolymerase